MLGRWNEGTELVKRRVRNPLEMDVFSVRRMKVMELKPVREILASDPLVLSNL